MYCYSFGWCCLVYSFKLIAKAYGIPYLILAPEYLGEVNFLSFLLLGVGLGLFVMAFHISSYIYYCRRFSFLATLQRPIYQFSINNSIIPFVFIIAFVVLSLRFQVPDEQFTYSEAIVNISGFLLGLASIISIVFTYFFSINKNLFSRLGGAVKPLGDLISTQEDASDEQTRVQTYLYSFTKIRYVRGVAHYDSSFLERIWSGQFRGASCFFAAVVILIIGLGLFRAYDPFLIPAAASIFILTSIYILFVAVIYSWFPRWYISVLILVLIGFNAFWKLELAHKTNKAFGLSYEKERPANGNEALPGLLNQEKMDADLKHHKYILNRWHIKRAEPKPPLIVVQTSGGGLRSVLFTSKVLNRADAYTDGEFYNHLRLFSGASGGYDRCGILSRIESIRDRFGLY